jgi:hypothetical protein
MRKTLSIVGRAIALWWREFVLLTFFNLAWLALQIPIVTGPPATAAIYAIARRLVDDEFIDPRFGWVAFHQMFLPALKWGAVNLVILETVIGNFWAYREAVGLGWSLLRLAWGTIALGWFSVNLFYWPFWLVQKDRSLRTTLRNSALFLAKQPGFAFPLSLMCAIFIIVSVLTTLSLSSILMVWIALIGVLAVDEELRSHRELKSQNH